MTGLIDQPITLDEVVRFLASTPFFDVLDAFERADVARILVVERFQRDEVVFKEGAPGDAWYIVFEGEVRVLKDTPDGPMQTARLPRAPVSAKWRCWTACRVQRASSRRAR